MKLVEVLRETWNVGPAGIVVLAGPVVVVACLAVAVVARRHRAIAGAASVAALAAHATFALAACAIFVGTRWRLIDQLLGSRTGWAFMRQIEQALATETFAGAATVALLPFVAVAVAIAWTRVRGGSAALPVAFVASAASIVLAVALLAIVDARAFEHAAYGGCQGHDCYEIVVGTSGATDFARAAVLALLVVGAAAIAIVARRAPLLGPGARAACVACFAIGALAFASTRGHARDAERPLAWDPRPAVDLSMPAEGLPLAPEGCFGAVEWPILAVHDGVSTLDGVAHADIGSALAARRAVVSVRLAGARAQTLAIAADADNRSMAPYVAVARASGFTELRAIRRYELEPVITSTLGRVLRTPRVCTTPLAPDAPGGAWKDWVITASPDRRDRSPRRPARRRRRSRGPARRSP